MATFSIDLITGKPYLFSGDFTNSGMTTFSGVTTVNNGLSMVTSRKAKLGGTLTCSTVITKGAGNTAGIEYGGDYSASFSNRSLVDKGYVDSQRANITLQLVDISGSSEVNNIPQTPVIWTTTEFTGTTFNFTGGSKIHITLDGVYGVGYTLNLLNKDNNTKTIGSLIRKNGNVDIFTTTSTSHILNNVGTNVMAIYKTNLVAGDYIELVAFRIGEIGSVYTVPDASWLTLIKY